MDKIVMPPPLVCVIIPAHNKRDTIGRAIQSVMSQTLSNLECVIIDDASADGSDEVIRENINGDKRFRYIRTEYRNVAKVRNRGVLEETTAPFVCALDGDDSIAPTFLEVCVRALLQDSSLGIAYTGLYYIKPNGEEGLSPWPTAFDYNGALAGRNPLPTCNVARREVWTRLGGQRARYSIYGAGEEDAEMWLRAGAAGWNAKKVSEEGLFTYSWMSGQVSGNPQHKMTDYRAWHPYVTDGIQPFASMARPHNGVSHAVRPYDDPKITVVIPIGEYHRDLLVDALDSVEAQGFRDYEVVAVADGFPIPQWYRDAYPYVTWVELPERQGAGAARNAGIKAARSHMILPLDADDYFTTDALSVLYNASRVHPGHIVYGDYRGRAILEPRERERLRAAGRLVSFDEKTNESVISYSSMEYDCELAAKQPHLNPDGSFYIFSLCTMLMPKVYLDEIGGYDPLMPSWEDWSLMLQLAWAGKCFVRIPRPLVEYRFYTGQRRALANPNENGTSARQLSIKLIEYLQDKRGRSTIMPCGGCKKHTPTYSSPTPTPQMAQSAPTARSIAMGNVSSDAFVTVELIDGNEGDHPISFGGQFYGYKSNGDRFKMLREHAVHLRAVRILNDSDMFPASDVAPQRVAPPAPKPIEVARGVAEDFAVAHAMYEQREEVVSPVTAERTITLQPEVFDFTRIWGINEERQQLLVEMGIRSLDGFMAMDSGTLADMFELQPPNIARMMKSAEKLR